MTRSEQPTHRLGELLGFVVVTRSGRVLGHLNDVRLAPTTVTRGLMPELVVEGLVVDGRHAASLLGYDRRAEQGPRLVRLMVRWLHRRAGYLPWRDVERVMWTERRVRVRAEDLQPLEAS
jgi:sporulation protein YlmC with PRC-barrel domain